MPEDIPLPQPIADEFLGSIVILTPDHRVLSWNDGSVLLFGYSREEAVGRALTDLIVPTDNIQEFERRAAEAVTSNPVMHETVRRHKDGTRVHVEVLKRAVRDASGAVLCLAINQRDITSMTYMRNARLLEERFGGLLEAAPDAMVIVDQDGRIVLANSQAGRLFGHERERLLGKPIEVLVPARFQPSHPRHRDGYFHTPSVRPMGAGIELYGRKADGSEFPVEISLSPMQHEDHTLVTAAIRDATERREQYVRLQEVSRLKSMFLANMSHELRTPLNAVIGFAELLHDARVGPVEPQQKEYLADILSSSGHLLQIVNDILDLSKIEAGQMSFHPENIRTNALLTDVVDGLRTSAAAKNLTVTTFADPQLESIHADPARVKQVLYNYLSNAIKFTPDGGHIRVSATRLGNIEYRLEVADDGIGIQEVDLDRLFSEFSQLDSGMSKKYAGTGLGLALTKKLVERLGGRVGVTSAAGSGSIFFAVLPLQPR